MEKSSQSRYMTKLHKSGNLGSFDYESYDTSESCLLGKMTKLSFKRTCKWAFRPNTYRLCGPMSTHARLMAFHSMGTCIL